MKILFVADGRSPTSQNWIRYFVERGDDIYLASTFECDVDIPIKRLEFIPVAFSSAKKKTAQPGSASSRTLSLRTLIRQWLGPLTIPRSAKQLHNFIQEVQPDLVHAMRVPYEGMLTAYAYSKLKDSKPPFIVSVWGNDFTLHASSTPLMKRYTRLTMQSVNGLHADTERDIDLAHKWGLSVDKPTLAAPGNGGIRSDIFYPAKEPVTTPVIINPRGFRPYVRNDIFFKSIPLVLAKRPEAKFICSSMQGEIQAIEWIKELNIEHAVQLNPLLSHSQMADVFRSSQIIVSPAIHDGTPNSLLEGMACGCFPVAGDLESIREWITHGQNGLLVDPNDAQSIADGILLAIEREDLRHEAAGLNAKIISTGAEYGMNMKRVDEFYKLIL
ncbi:MAG: glycosyltransferase family 4 protein [Anaerolineales bacterium]|nr:glycosyltransferase family 4 protein [Anaerolineales bacterium]